MQQYLIGDLAKKAQLSTDSIRFYEKKLLIKANFRAENNYKYYDEETLKRLIFIKRCRALDISLHEIAELIELTKQPKQDCLVIDHLIEQHIQQVEEKLNELQKFKTQLQELRQSCSSNTTVDRCNILKNLKLSTDKPY
ncbi:transcriptional regulator [Acinetobacter sp. ANC 4470]|uniref:MerR family DNA-binding protein n=1 Tax=Acinetobacter sp. ANC 4470 TaxID=1977881 RepID=UPI000A32B55D|nr:MerR family DNA-binding protein [Acinetobacter sp. ANC 4470]OTG66224.1 transcriptional regulator [Acinetobacter sp. ANC 4470]